jgi:hypothetical protein
MVGNFDVDVEQQQRVGHLLSPLPPENLHPKSNKIRGETSRRVERGEPIRYGRVSAL